MTTTPGYRPPIPRWWWAKRRSYRLFMLRELSSVFVAWSVVYLAGGVWAVGCGRYPDFLDFSARPPVVVANIVTLGFLLLHTITWLGLAPRALVIHLRGRRVPTGAVLAGHYAAWLVVSAVIAWVVLA
ncbi:MULTISPECIES: fumarate reductase subunit C [unclassified Mycolicibacterium]|uniref:fumarate reductase subunit C n=1 Tax=unclassified Mycolicibacterium TaxID=2636767 RepID=UPI0012DFD13D|nr:MULTISPECIES: fumarate reductase subunit C [unclassified Mycolicibacterium]MUL85663.1 fumarate reductase subunit C [Mycolicibacterium sp. CBMA 329]MUL91540.1 fumarate reductase subunit C [Mycolicibacterium sp. CBMA 331]MUM02220.1 fumarate reductase subunit C [Mycolicibacterium sp. CBMA 334]MUM27321.1 fumarate reductase subunit C [Mycolicibacterium sp. CBMA 295]MUM41170.1 fumarate reductase subunit C [Mycolicibacterium sp. CBMA 247]